jgi:hypothetical protein
MKSKFLVVCMILGLLATANSGYSKHPNASGYVAVISDYIDSYTNSDFKKLNKILSDDACVKIPRAEKVIIQNKASLVAQMKADATIQNCTSKYEVIAKSDAIVLARVDFEYENFKQQNFIILEKNEDKEWKITQVCKIFQSKNKPADPSESLTASN